MNKYVKLAIQIVLVAVVVFLVFQVYNSVMEPVKYDKERVKREKVIVKKLNQIKELQIEYKKMHSKYAADFDSLRYFYNNESMPVVLKKGTVDTLSEEKALELGLITRDTTYVPYKDTLFYADEAFNIKTIDIVPFTNGKVKFEMDASTVKRANFDVPVFEVTCLMEDYLANIKYEELRDNEINILIKDDKFPGLRLGSMNEPTTDGNWNF